MKQIFASITFGLILLLSGCDNSKLQESSTAKGNSGLLDNIGESIDLGFQFIGFGGSASYDITHSHFDLEGKKVVNSSMYKEVYSSISDLPAGFSSYDYFTSYLAVEVFHNGNLLSTNYISQSGIPILTLSTNTYTTADYSSQSSSRADGDSLYVFGKQDFHQSTTQYFNRFSHNEADRNISTGTQIPLGVEDISINAGNYRALKFSFNTNNIIENSTNNRTESLTGFFWLDLYTGQLLLWQETGIIFYTDYHVQIEVSKNIELNSRVQGQASASINGSKTVLQ